MNFGSMLPSRGPLARPEHPSVITKRGEELSYGSLMFPDHILMPRNISSQYPYPESVVFPGTDNSETMERLTTLAFLAGQTTTIRLVTSVMVVSHRSPIFTAKALATLDILSQGRVTVEQRAADGWPLPGQQTRLPATSTGFRSWESTTWHPDSTASPLWPKAGTPCCETWRISPARSCPRSRAPARYAKPRLPGQHPSSGRRRSPQPQPGW